MTLDEIIARIEADRGAHTTSGSSDERELRQIEALLGRPIPPALRTFLARVGGGIFYGRHEIFGAHRVMIHDIELVPSMRSILERFQTAPSRPPEGWLPFHRADRVWHCIDLTGAGTVVSWPPGQRHASLAAFLEHEVLPARRNAPR